MPKIFCNHPKRNVLEQMPTTSRTRLSFKTSILMLVFFLLTTISSCNQHMHKVKTVHPITHKRFFNPKKDKYRTRTKKVKLKSN